MPGARMKLIHAVVVDESEPWGDHGRCGTEGMGKAHRIALGIQYAHVRRVYGFAVSDAGNVDWTIATHELGQLGAVFERAQMFDRHREESRIAHETRAVGKACLDCAGNEMNVVHAVSRPNGTKIEVLKRVQQLDELNAARGKHN